LKVPRKRAGEFETAIFERYQRNEQAPVLAMMEMDVNGVSTRNFGRITEKLCGKEFSQSTVSRLTEKLNKELDAWCNRKLRDEYPFLQPMRCKSECVGMARSRRRQRLSPSESMKMVTEKFSAFTLPT
jgi:hypothetical protein